MMLIAGGNLWSTVLQPKDDDDRDFFSWAIVSLIKNKTQTAVMNIVSFSRCYKLDVS